ncbi:MAG TPA: aspartyl protease family protein [Polyangia bacterium]|nr:aspartyl protease family protein [Polyangia bacterium]
MRVAWTGAVLVAGIGCVTGPPPDWSAGREWSFPILDPFDDTAVGTLGTIDGHGPYVWFFDTGSTFTTIDARVANELGLHALAAGRVSEAGGTTDRIGVISDGQVKQWRIGDLTVRDPSFVVTRSFRQSYRGYRVAGMFGLASIRYLTIEIDPDAGRVRLALPGVARVPAQPPAASVYTADGQVVVKVEFKGGEKPFALDTGAAVSTVYPEVAQELKLGGDPGFHVQLRGLRSVINAQGAFVGAVRVGGADHPAVRFVAQPGDRQGEAVGLLGQNFLSHFHVFLDMDEKRLVLAPRRRVGAASRVDRFGADVRCPGMTVLQCFEGGAIEEDEGSAPGRPAFHYELAMHGSPPRAVELELELVDEGGLPVMSPFRFGVVLPGGDKPFASKVPLELRADAELLDACYQALKRAHGVRIRDVRPGGAAKSAGTWVE